MILESLYSILELSGDRDRMSLTEFSIKLNRLLQPGEDVGSCGLLCSQPTVHKFG